ncbi:MAG TPA: DUF1566 domain-containing protein [bacterium]|nr:DUF1566 domain-containing protein [bacterium]
MKKLLISLMFVLLFVIGSCGGDDKGNTGNTGDSGNSGDSGNTGDTGDTGNSGNSGNTGDPQKYKIAGFVQKGPFVQGSEIKIQELDNSLVPTGTSYTISTTDDFGSFEMSREMTSNFVEVTASGFYFNEVSGALSTAPINFRVIADLSENKPVNINILTTIERERIKNLIESGKTFSEARTLAETEILTVFNIKDIAGNFQEMDISKDGDANAVLLAVSVILQQGNGEAEMSELISKITQDIKSDGKLDGVSQQTEITENSKVLDLVSIRTNIETRYTGLGLTDVVIPKFEDFVDSDGDSLINRYDFTADFDPIENGDLNTEYTSNEIKIVLLPEAKEADVTIDNGIIIVNGEKKGVATKVKNEDHVAVNLKSSEFKYDETISATIKITYLYNQKVEGVFSVTAPKMRCYETTCSDKIYNLEWQKDIPENRMTWNDAVSYCNNLKLDEKSDWRLPNINELRTTIINCPDTMLDGACKIPPEPEMNCGCDGTAESYSSFKNEKKGPFWSSTTSNDGSQEGAWGITFSSGYIYWAYNDEVNDSFVRCVRGESIPDDYDDEYPDDDIPVNDSDYE